MPVAQFTAPVFATSAPGEPDNLYVVEQAGRILVLQNGKTRATPFLDISSLVSTGGERGLFSIAFPQDHGTTGLCYVDYTDTNGNAVVAS